jgi:hypothetical protein
MLKEYVYICKDTNGKLFALAGNFRVASLKPHMYLYPISDEPIKYWIETPFGYISNVSTVKAPNKFSIIYQIDMNTYRATLSKSRKQRV